MDTRLIGKALTPIVLLASLAAPAAYSRYQNRSFDQNEALISEAAKKTGSQQGTVLDAATVDTFPGSEVDRLTASGLGRFSQGEFTGAVTDFTNAIKVNPKRGGLHLQRGLCYLELEKFDLALADFDQAHELDKGNKTAILVCRGRALAGLKKFDLSLADLSEAIQDDPKFGLAFISRADTYLSMGQDDKALADLEQALQIDPKQPKAYFLRARYYKHQNKTDLALQDITTAVNLDRSFLEQDYSTLSPADKELRDHFAKSLKLGKKKELSAQLIERGMALERNGEYMEAIREFTDAIGDSPESLEAYKWRAQVYMHMSSFDHALADLDKAIAISPKDANLHVLRAKAYMELGQSEKAIADYSDALEISPTPPASLFEARGLVYSRLGKSNEAILDFGKSIELDPQGSTAYADRGLEYLVRKRYQDAIADFSDSIGRNHDLPVSYKFRGQSKHYLGDQKGAIADLEKAAQLYKDNNDLFGFKQVDKMVVEIKKNGDKSSDALPSTKSARKS